MVRIDGHAVKLLQIRIFLLADRIYRWLTARQDASILPRLEKRFPKIERATVVTPKKSLPCHVLLSLPVFLGMDPKPAGPCIANRLKIYAR
jgi:hypothetical protein